MLSQERLHEIFFHTHTIGVLTWRAASRGHRAGMVAGSLGTNGYVQIWVDGRSYPAHRLIWLFVYGQWPKDGIDHYNGKKADNRICNLREATTAQNGQNRQGAHVTSTSGFLGVFWYARKRKWKGPPRHLGYFDTLIDAAAARLRAERAMFTHATR